MPTESFFPNRKYERSSTLPEMLINQKMVGTAGRRYFLEQCIWTHRGHALPPVDLDEAAQEHAGEDLELILSVRHSVRSAASVHTLW